MLKHALFQAIPRNEVPKDVKILTSSWAKKKKLMAHSEQIECKRL